ncbi:MAG: helix-turn-helix domain-containing protein [Polyangiaceae bacterium]|nr:helix-turn-helix domain-containing protein [Polyangiaceae bacterium]
MAVGNNPLAAAPCRVHTGVMDYDELARGVLRALRGKRSQLAFSRRLGYSTNVAYAWESGRRSPTAAETLRAAVKVGVDVRGALTPFFQRVLPEELKTLDPDSPAFVAALLRDVRGTASMEVLASRTDLSRSAISRILSGKTEPRLPVFLRLVDVASRRLLDMLAGLVDMGSIPAAQDEWRRVEALRRLAHTNPLSEAVPRFLELDQYAKLARHRPGWIAERLGISREDEERTLRDLEAAGVVRWDGVRWLLDRQRSVDTTRFDRRAAARLGMHWTEEARSRIAAGGEGQFAYLVFTTDDETLAAIQELRLRFFRELRALVAASSKNRRVAVANVNLFPIDVGARDDGERS